MAEVLEPPMRDEVGARSFNTTFGTEIIHLVIGHEQKVYRIHKSKLYSKIPSFITIVEQTQHQMEPYQGEAIEETNHKGIQADISETTIFLPEGNIASWEVLLKWVYHSTLPRLIVDRKSPSGWSWDPFLFYALVDSLSLHSLSDEVMNLLQVGQAKTKLWHTNETLSWTWTHTKPDCGIRRYLALSLVRSIMVYKDPKDVDPSKRVFTVETKEIADMLSALPNLLIEVLALMRGMDGMKARDPRIADPCEFHGHWPRKACGYDGEGSSEGNTRDQERKKSDASDEESK